MRWLPPIERASPSPVTTQTSRSGRVAGQTGGDGRGAAVDRVHPVGVHVVREASRAADPRQEHRVLAAHAEVGHEHLHGGQDRVVPAARAPADLLVARPVLAGGDGDGGGGHCAPSSIFTMTASISPARKGTPWTLVSDLGVDEEFGPHQLAQLAQVDLGDEDLGVAAEHLAQVGRERVQVDEVGVGDREAPGPHPADGRPRWPRRWSPSRAPAPRRRRPRRRPRAAGMSLAMPAILAARRWTIRSWLIRVVGDVAAAVGLLEPADAVLEAGQARGGPGAGQRLGVADVGPERLGAVLLGVVGLGGELGVDRGQGRRRRGAATARPRWPGSRRRAGSPASGT